MNRRHRPPLARRATLLRHFGSVRKLSRASVAEIAGLPGIGPRVAETVVAALHRDNGGAGPGGAEGGETR